MVAKTYPSTLASLRSRVYDRIQASATAGHSATNEKIRAALNDGQKEIQNELLILYKGKHFVKTLDSLSPVDNKIRLPDDFKRPVTFDKYVGSPGLWVKVNLVSPVEHEKYGGTSLSDVLEGVTVLDEGWSIVWKHLVCHLSTSVSGTYRLRYQFMIPDLQADHEKSQLPDDYHEMLVDYAAWIMEEDAGHDRRAETLRKRYERRLGEMVRTAGASNQAERKRIRNVRRLWRF